MPTSQSNVASISTDDITSPKLPNFENRTFWISDNLPILREIDDDVIDLIYLDPPFNSKRIYHAPLGSQATGATFNDIWTMDSVKQELSDLLENVHPAIWRTIEGAGESWGDAMKAYLVFMTPRLLEMHRILRSTGSLYLHCDPHASHYLKQLLDSIFGPSNFRNEIIWHYGKMSNTSVNFPRNHDIILRYTKTDRYVFTPIKGAESEYRNRYKRYLEKDNRVLFKSVRQSTDKLILGRIKKVEKQLGRSIRDEDALFDFDTEFKVQSDVIYVSIIKGNSKERTGWPTQKPLELLRKIILSSTEDQGMVLDPFAGCATTCIAAEELGRKWAGIDIDSMALEVTVDRLKQVAEDRNAVRGDRKKSKASSDQIQMTGMQLDPTTGKWVAPQVIVRDTPPRRTDPHRPTRTKNSVLRKILWSQLDEDADGERRYCPGCRRAKYFEDFDLDHIQPKAKGGADIDDNIQLLCRGCNNIKGSTKTMKELREKLLADKILSVGQTIK